MKRYYFIQYFQRFSSGLAMVALVVGLVFSLWHLFSKPEKSKIILDGFERISFSNDLKCDNMQLRNSSITEQFPISFSYEINDIDVGIDTDTEHFNGEFRIKNAAKIFVRFTNYDFDHEVELEFTELPNSVVTDLTVNASWFSWDTSISEWGLEEIKSKIPESLIPPSSLRYEVGLCGQNLSFLPKYNSATVDDLYSMGVKVVPVASESGGYSLYKMYFMGLSKLNIDGSNISIPDETETVEIFVVLENTLENDVFSANSAKSSIEFVATNISDYLILGGDSSTGASPGLIYVYDEGTDQEYRIGWYSDILPKNIRFNNKRITIVSPKGSIITNSPKIDIPAESYQMVLYSTFFSPLKFDFNDKNLYHYWSRGGGYEIDEEGIGALVDGREYLPSPWETIPGDIRVAYITVFIPLLAALIGYGIQKRKEIDTFFEWLFSIPRYRQPITLHEDAHIFQLINGKKISGIIEKLEGRSTFRVFVLKEVREWDKDNWSEVLPTEVRVPQNKIEMYYKAHP